MSAKIINLVLEQGTDFQSTFTIYNENGSKLNLTNYTAKSVIKKHPTSSTSYPFTISFPNRAEGKVMVAQKGGKPLPSGALIDSSGNLTINPEVMYGKINENEVPNSENGTGAITAFGLHKGSGINFMMEILGGALTGSGVSAGIDDKEKRKFANGMLSLYVKVDNMVNFEYFLNEVRSYADFVRSSPPANKNEKVLIPGDKEISTYKDRLANGLPVAPIVWQNIKQTAKDLNIPNLDRFNSAINKT